MCLKCMYPDEYSGGAVYILGICVLFYMVFTRLAVKIILTTMTIFHLESLLLDHSEVRRATAGDAVSFRLLIPSRKGSGYPHNNLRYARLVSDSVLWGTIKWSIIALLLFWIIIGPIVDRDWTRLVGNLLVPYIFIGFFGLRMLLLVAAIKLLKLLKIPQLDAMIARWESGGDIYAAAAIQMFHVPMRDVTPEMRRIVSDDDSLLDKPLSAEWIDFIGNLLLFAITIGMLLLTVVWFGGLVRNL